LQSLAFAAAGGPFA
jgi:hypothetical protein